MRFDTGVRQSTVARTEIDVAATHRIADRFGAAAGLIDGAANDHLAGLMFGGERAGRAYTARGDALRVQLQRLAAELSQWSHASADIAVSLRAGADRYAGAELYAAARIA